MSTVVTELSRPDLSRAGRRRLIASLSVSQLLDRRAFLWRTFLLAGVAASGPLLTACGGGSSGGSGGGVAPRQNGRFANLGPLGEPNEFGVRLPEGFTMRIIAQATKPVADTGYRWHIFPDGGGVMPREGGGWYYISNSEVPGVGSIGFAIPELAPLTDPLEFLVPGLGGTSVIAFAADGTITDAYRILSGTTFNCAGCVTPWRTWLSCEEIPEGLVWECDPTGREKAVSRPTLGKFAHEATAVDDARKVIYMTEDHPSGRFYRWLPAEGDWPEGAARPALKNGRLQVMQVVGEGVVSALERPQPVVWVDALKPTQAQYRNRVADSTPFDGGEGLWIHDSYVYFSTKGDDRIWVYDIDAGMIEVLYDFATSDNPILSGVDNITVTDQGDVLVAEDGGDMQVVIILPDGQLKPLLQIVGQDESEVAGIAFSPDGRHLYFTSDRGGQRLNGGYTGLGLGITYELTLPPGL